MVHLSNPTTIGIMVFYSLITFFIMPLLTRPFFKHLKDPCIIGFTTGFVVSILLWHFFGRDYVLSLIKQR